MRNVLLIRQTQQTPTLGPHPPQSSTFIISSLGPLRILTMFERLLLNQDANLSTKFVEIIGVVKDDLTIKMAGSMNMGDDLGALAVFVVLQQGSIGLMAK